MYDQDAERPSKLSKHSTTTEANHAGWLGDELSDGFALLTVLSLDGQPAAEIVLATKRAWLDTLTKLRSWDRERDAVLVRKAFEKLRATCDRWPSPRRFLEMLDAVTPTATYVPLPPPTTIPKTLEERREHLKSLCADFQK